MNDFAPQLLLAIASQFQIPVPQKIDPLGQGNINRTYLVSSAQEKYVLQAINRDLYPQPEKVIHNILEVTRAQQEFFQASPPEIPVALIELVPSKSSEYLIWDHDQSFRLFRYLEGGLIFQNLGEVSAPLRTKVAYELGKGWARFHTSIASIPLENLEILLPNFHDTATIFEQFLRVKEESEQGKTVRNWKTLERSKRIVRLILDRQELALSQRPLKVPRRPTHNDTKLNNCVFVPDIFSVLCLLDLDTIQAGCVHFDVGDGIRSAANLAGEETQELKNVRWDQDSVEAILAGYLDNAPFLTEEEKKILPLSPQIIAFELGIRFFTDYLQGDIYFRNFISSRPNRNLERAEVQFKLVENFKRCFQS
ncbi:MAG: aminoglycoside phosphotransferase family protein [Planctomycetota bacterium]